MKKNRNNNNNNRNQRNRSLNLNKKSVSKLNETTVNGGRAASNITFPLTDCLSEATHCAQCDRDKDI